MAKKRRRRPPEDAYDDEAPARPRRKRRRSASNSGSTSRKSRSKGLSDVAVRAIAGGYLVLTLICVGLFFMTWIRAGAPDGEFALTQTGMEIASGSLSVGGKSMERQQRAVAGEDKENEWVSPPMWVYLGALVVGLIGAVVHVAIGGRTKPIVPVLGLGVAVAVLIICLSTRFPLEQFLQPDDVEIAQERDPSKDLARTAVPIISAVVCVLATAAAITHYALIEYGPKSK